MHANIYQIKHIFLHLQGYIKMAKNHYTNYTLPNMRHYTADTS